MGNMSNTRRALNAVCGAPFLLGERDGLGSDGGAPGRGGYRCMAGAVRVRCVVVISFTSLYCLNLAFLLSTTKHRNIDRCMPDCFISLYL